MKMDRVLKTACCVIALAFRGVQSAQTEPEFVERDLTRYVNQFMGSSCASKGHLRPIASVPFGMVQLGPDTTYRGSGYHWEDDKIMGFTHTHMVGGGCNDYMDILFMPVVEDTSLEPTAEDMRQAYGSVFSHEDETSLPGYYRVQLQDENITAELTASERCAVHRYTYPAGSDRKMLIDLLHGARGGCTIVKEDSKTIVHDSFLRQVDEYTIEGYRVSSSWAKHQHAYFVAKFSEPITAFTIFSGDEKVQADSLHCTRLKAIVDFGESDRPLEIKVGISPVSMEGARNNLKAELGDDGFDEVCARAVEKWEKQLSKFQIETDDDDLRTIFYTCLHNVFLYPMLYSDVDGKFRGPDHEVHQADGFDYYAGVLGLWDNFRAANPLLTIANPKIANEQVRTFLAHYNICGLLPIWTLAGHETLTMIGYHAMPIIADAYYKGVRNYDADAVFEAMKASANKDEFGLSMRRMMGTKNYKKYGYIPADLEYESVAQTLEFSYDDWCIAQMAKMLGREEDYAHFMERSKSYRNIIDPETKFARGRMTDGSWREPFDPRASTHRRDDYCEGNAWQWTFFVPHDPAGLAEIMGGKAELEKKLDGMFSAPSEIVGEHRSGDISGLIGQYAHGNEPSHHTAYLYNFVGAPWKTQNRIDRIMREMYANNPDGVCGNDDTGQMSAWYVFSAMGFYPVTHGTGRYEIGTPLLDRLVFHHGDKNEHTLTIVAKNRTPENKYIQRILLDGKPYREAFFRHEDIFSGDHEIVYEMTDDFTSGDFFTSGDGQDNCQETALKAESLKDYNSRMEWFAQAQYGMFIHFGLYSILGGEWRGETVKGYAEWIQAGADIPRDEYAPLIRQFNPEGFDADFIARTAKDAGMKYIVITSKHHDGFCLWDSAYTDFDVAGSPFAGRDILAELSAACRRHGLKFGIYYSIIDWHHPSQVPNASIPADKPFSRWGKNQMVSASLQNGYFTYLKDQVLELIDLYNPDLLWFDGDWARWWTLQEGIDLYNTIRGASSKIIVNNRVAKRGGFELDFVTQEQEHFEGAFPKHWEGCYTMNKSWGYKKNDHNWKDAQTIYNKLKDINEKGGNLLLNVGPDGNGEIQPEAIDLLEKTAQMLNAQPIKKNIPEITKVPGFHQEH